MYNLLKEQEESSACLSGVGGKQEDESACLSCGGKDDPESPKSAGI